MKIEKTKIIRKIIGKKNTLMLQEKDDTGFPQT